MNEYAAEAKERWGHTEAYRESTRRTASYSEADWAQQRGEAADIDAGLIALMEEGIAPDDERAAAMAEQHRQHISKWFYHCSTPMHAALGAMYHSDSRFTESIERAGDGLAVYLSQAIAANAASRD